MSFLDIALLSTTVALGFFGSGHCIAMCGGICSALSFALPPAKPWLRIKILLGYNLGRIISYVLLAVILTFFTQQFAMVLSPNFAQHYLSGLRFIAGLLLIAMGFYLANWWRGLVYLERVGQKLWKFFVPYTKNLLPVTSFPKSLIYGAVWGWLPCGLVYSALALSVAQADMVNSSLAMFGFGLGTLPALFATGMLADKFQKLLNNKHLRVFFALTIIVFGVWTLMYSGDHDHGSHSDSSSHDHHSHH